MSWFTECPSCHQVAEPRKICDCGYTTYASAAPLQTSQALDAVQNASAPEFETKTPPQLSPRQKKLQEQRMADPVAIAHLGPALHSCHARSYWGYLAAEGVSMLRALWMTIAGTVIGSCILSAIPLSLIDPDHKENEWLMRAIFLVSFAGWSYALMWVSFLRFRGDFLILHENGFRFRIGFFKRGRVHFADVAHLILGGDLSPFESFGFRWLQFTGHLEESVIRIAPRNRLILELRNGQQHVIKGFGARFEPHDYAKFLQFIDEKYPELIRVHT